MSNSGLIDISMTSGLPKGRFAGASLGKSPGSHLKQYSRPAQSEQTKAESTIHKPVLLTFGNPNLIQKTYFLKFVPPRTWESNSGRGDCHATAACAAEA